MIKRDREIKQLRGLLRRHRILGIVGARQVGKTTLARMLARDVSSRVHYFDLENPEDLVRLADPMMALKPLKGLVVVDEIQRFPDLFTILRVLADRPGSTTRFLILGSASPELLKQSSESLAGRIVYHELHGFAIEEIGVENRSRLWFRGGLPRSYLARSHAASGEWRQGYIRTFLERDLPQLGVTVSSSTMRRFWTMLAHYHGQVWNSSEFARSFGVADTTVRGYLDKLTSALVVRQLLPWHENISKRQVRSPKVYLADSGVLHELLNLKFPTDLDVHPKAGASWEGFVIEQVVHQLGIEHENVYFWATHSGAELDLMVVHGRRRFGFEIKLTSAPKLTPSMRIALEDLKLHRLDVIHAGDATFPLTNRIRAVSVSRILKDIRPLK